MMSNTRTVQTCRFEVDEKRRKVEALEVMIGDFRQMVSNLDYQIVAEQEKAGIDDVNHFAYPTFAKAAIKRRDNLTTSIDDLAAKLELARVEMEEAVEEMTKAEQLQFRDKKHLKPQHDVQHPHDPS